MKTRKEIEEQISKLKSCSCSKSIVYLLEDTSIFLNKKDSVFFHDSKNNEKIKNDYIKQLEKLL